MPDSAPAPDVSGVVRWLLLDAPGIDDLGLLFQELHQRLAAEGVRVDRIWGAFLLLHPQMAGRSHLWRPEVGLLSESRVHGAIPVGVAASNPLMRLMAGEPEVRLHLAVRLEGERAQQLAAEGYTDYLMAPGPALTKRQRAWRAFSPTFRGARSLLDLAWATRAPGGWTDAQLEALRQVHPALGMVLVNREQAGIGAGLLEAYLGRDAANRVLDGQVRRGEVRTTEAAILFTDLRDFTRLSEQLAPAELLQLLDDAFDAQIVAIEECGGSVLQIVGDGLLAIFEASAGPRSACDAAVAAVAAIAVAIDRVNDRREANGAPRIGWGAGLHFGQVHHGNFGAAGRLAFTVNGPAVNRAARLEAAGARLGARPAMSSEFVEHVGVACRRLGTVEAKGLSTPLDVFARQ